MAMFASIPAAQGDIFSYTDKAGVVHYTNVAADPRYVLVLSSPVERQVPDPNNAAYLASAAVYDPIIERAAKLNRLHPDLLRAVIVMESAYNPRAVSARGAKGLMQLEPATAARYRVSDVFDPSQNVNAGSRYLHDLLQRYDGKLEIALAAYNAGEQAVERYGRRIPPFAETLHYVPSVLRMYRSLLAQAQAQAKAPATA
ncbi:MAG TPA: transglycosylase SLT domain-containing protein, partial [Steroidobacteraceae bacterium]